MRDEIRWRKLFRLVQAMALRNIVRQKHRTAFTLGAIAFGVASLILTGGFIQDIYRQLANAIIYSQSGHLQVARAGYFETGIRNPSAFLAEEQSLRAVIGSVQSDVVQSMARMSSAGVISTGRRERPVLVEGIEPSKEAALGVSFKHLEGEALKDDEKFSVAIGAGLAQALKLKAGDTATLLVTTPDGAFNTVDLKVAGVFQSFFKEYDNRVVRMPLATLQDVLAARGANTLVVQLKDGADARVVAETLRGDGQGRL